MRNIVVTGAAGFIGSEVVARLLARGDQVLAIDDLSVGRREALPTLPAVLFRQLDIRNTEALAAACSDFRPEAVLHLAAIHHIPTCEAKPVETLSVNIVGTESVLAAAACSGANLVVVASSGAVYDWQDAQLTETGPLKPRDTYSLSKATNEAQMERWTAKSGIRSRAARLFNVVGPNDPNAHLIPDLLTRLSSLPAVPQGVRHKVAIGATTTVRDYVDTRDAADALVHLLDDPTVDPIKAYNICSGQGVSTGELAQLLAETLGVPAEFVVDPALLRPIDRPSQIGNPKAMAQDFGWRVSFPLSASLSRIITTPGRKTAL